MKRIMWMLPVLWGGNLAGQGLGAVLSSLQERHLMVASVPVQWNGMKPGEISLPQFPSDGDVANLGIEDRLRLLAQAAAIFRDVCPNYLNVRPADLLASEGSAVGSITPFTGIGFQTYGLIEPATYRDVLRKLALDVGRLRVLAAPSVTAQVTTTKDSFHRHQAWIDDDENPETPDVLTTFDEDDVETDDPPDWQPDEIGIGSEATSEESATGSPADSISVNASYGEVDDEEHEELKKRLDWEVTRIQVRSVAAHLPTGWSGGTAVALARVSWNPWTGEVPQSSNDCAYRVVGNAAGDGAISVNQQDADIDVAGNWTDLASDGTSSFIPDGFVFAKEGDNRVGFDWSLGIPGNATLYRRYYVCVLIPTFSKGLDEATARNSLDKLRGITPPPAADGRALPRPLPGMIFGINLGPGLDDGTSSAWLAVVPSMSPCWYSYEAFIPFGYEIGQIPFSWQGWRFDCVPALRFIGAETDYQVVYGTSRDPSVRNWDLPSCGTGNDIFLASGWCYQNRFLEAWDAPSIRQVVGKHLVADVTVTGGFSQVVKIYRRNGDTFTRTPGVAVDPSGLTLLRTLTIGNPSGLTGLGSGAEHLKISDDTGTDLDISLGVMSNYRWDWEFKLTKHSDGLTSWREFWDSDHTTNNITDMTQNGIAPHYTVSLIREGVAAGTVTGLPGPCHAWPETPESYTNGDISVTWNTTSTGRVTHVTGDPDLVEVWQPLSGFGSGTPGGLPHIPTRLEKGPWKAEFSLPEDTVLKTKFSLDSQLWRTTWEEWTSSGAGGESVKIHSTPDGMTTAMTSSAVSWVRTDFGGLDGAAGTLPWEVRKVIASDNGGTLITLNPAGDGGLETVVERGGFSGGGGNNVSRGIRWTWSRDAAGYPVEASGVVFSGASAADLGSATWSVNKTAWGAPTGVTYSPSGLDESWSYATDNLNQASRTDVLGVTTAFTSRDIYDRVTAGTCNGLGFSATYLPGGAGTDLSWGGGAASGAASCRFDPVGHLLSASNMAGGRELSDTLYREDDGSASVTSSDSLTQATHTFGILPDGALGTASGACLPFGGVEGTGLTVAGGLFKATRNLEGQPATYQTTWTDAWGRVRKTETPAGPTDLLYSDPDSSLMRVRVTEPTGRKFITESDPYNTAGAITRSGIDVNRNGSLGASDRYVESVTTVAGGTLVTTLSLTEDSGLREILRTVWTPSGDQTVTTINNGEETITRTPDYGTKTVETVSTKGWIKNESFNNLGLTTSGSLTGAGIPAASLNPFWRADGSLESVSLTIGGATHSATFNPNGTLASLTAPGRSNILGGHSISGGVESLTVDGVTTVAKLDGTEVSTSGGDIIGKTDTLEAPRNSSGFQETIHPAVGSDTSLSFNAAGAATGKSYAAGAGESYDYTDGLLHSISLALGGELIFGYSSDGAKDLTSATWPAVSSGVFTIPAIAQGYGYDRAGRVDEIGDSSGARSIIYQNNKLKQTTWDSGALAGYKVVRGLDEYGRDTGFTLYRGGTVIHSVVKAPNDVSGEVSSVTTGGFNAILGRDGSRSLETVTRGSVIQRWQRGTAGGILLADTNSTVTGAPSFNYKGTANDEASAFDTKGRRLKCATSGGEWIYQYTNGQLTSAVHPTLGTFSYQFDGIGRRTDKGSANTSDLLNRTTAWTNSQNKTLKVTAHPDARVWVGVNNAAPSEIQNFTGTYSCAVPSPGAAGGWVPWNTLAVLEGEGDAGANPDAKAEQSGAVWVPPAAENLAYDDAGNRKSSDLLDYGWDAKNQLVRARTKNHNTATQGYDVTSSYDAEGRRFSKKVTRYQNGGIVEQKQITFIWDGWNLIYEREQLPSGLTTMERKYVWGPDIADGNAGGAGGLLLIRETKGDTTTDLYPLYDGTGHVVALADSAGTLQAEYAYGPFGEPIYAKGPHAQSCPFRYATKYYDQETVLYYFGKRYLDPVTGQWLSREPLGEDESLNLYAYGNGDPINRVDRLGLASVAVDGSLTTTSFGINALLGFSTNIFAPDWWEKASETQRRTWEYLVADIETAKLDEAARELADYKEQFNPMAVSAAFSRARMVADPDSYIFYRNYLDLADADNPFARLTPLRSDGGFIPYLDDAYEAGGEAAVQRAARPMMFLQGATSTARDMSPLGVVSTLASASGQFKNGHNLAGAGLIALAVIDAGVPGKLDTATLTLRRVDGMASREFSRKATALKELGEQGALFRAANPVARNSAITRAYRQNMVRRIWAQYGTRNPEFAEQLIRRVRRRMDPDHIHELQLGGLDAPSNLRFLDSFTNWHVGTQQIWPQIRDLPVGTPIRIRIE